MTSLQIHLGRKANSRRAREEKQMGLDSRVQKKRTESRSGRRTEREKVRFRSESESEDQVSKNSSERLKYCT